MARPTAPALRSDVLRLSETQSSPFYPLSMTDLVFLFGGTIAEAQQIVQRADFPTPVRDGGRWYWNGRDVATWARTHGFRLWTDPITEERS